MSMGGCCMDGWIFSDKITTNIEFKISKKHTVWMNDKSFTYWSVKDINHVWPLEMPWGWIQCSINAVKTDKEKNTRVVEFYDRFFSGDETTCPKVRHTPTERGLFSVSTKTIQHIRKKPEKTCTRTRPSGSLDSAPSSKTTRDHTTTSRSGTSGESPRTRRADRRLRRDRGGESRNRGADPARDQIWHCKREQN